MSRMEEGLNELPSAPNLWACFEHAQNKHRGYAIYQELCDDTVCTVPMAAQIKLHEPIGDVHEPMVDVVTMHTSDLGSQRLTHVTGVQLLCVCMYVCICMYVCMHVFVYMCVYMCMCVGMCVCMYAYVSMCMYLCVYVCGYVCVCMCMCVYVCAYVCMCVCNKKNCGNSCTYT